MTWSRSWSFVGLAVLVATATQARAQSSPEAEKLFRDAKAAMQAGKIDEACALFEASQKLESHIAAVMSLADCREKRGDLASAWGWFLQARSMTRDDAARTREHRVATERAAALEPRLSYLTIVVPESSRVEGLAITRGGVPMDRAAWGRAVPVDGGAHTIEARAPGYASWSTEISVETERDRASVEIPALEKLPEPAEPPPPRGGEVKTVVVVEPSLLTPRRKIGIGVAAGGGAAIAVGAVLGFQAQRLRDDAEATCPPSSCSPDDAADANAIDARAQRRALFANVAFATGGAAIAAGVVLWFVGAPPDRERGAVTVVPTLGPDGAGVAAAVRF